jgi:hypothetical protein
MRNSTPTRRKPEPANNKLKLKLGSLKIVQGGSGGAV